MNAVLVGASGYGEYYLSLFEEYIGEDQCRICAIVDPYAASSPKFEWIRKKNIPVFDTLEDFYGSRTADLVMLVSPIAFHKQQSILAMERGSAVLCEKPLSAAIEDAAEIREVWRKTGVPFGVGFQWSFSNAMQSLKSDIMNGMYGKPISMKTRLSWKRPDSYYEGSSWKGRIKDSHGRWVYDSIAMNAAAQFLHNMFFIIGDGMDVAASPESIEGSVYRGRDIESYDTIFLRGQFENGCRFLFTATHVGERHSDPVFVYEFERGVIIYDGNSGGEVAGVFADGEKKVYGVPQSRKEDIYKLYAMIESARSRTQPACTIDSAMPHLAVCGAVAREMTVKTFPKNITVKEPDPPSVHIDGLCDVMDAFYETWKLPDEQGCTWAEKSVTVVI